MLTKIKKLVNDALDNLLGAKERCVHRTPSNQPCQKCQALNPR